MKNLHRTLLFLAAAVSAFAALAFATDAHAQLFGRRDNERRDTNINVNGQNINVNRSGLFGRRTEVEVNGVEVADFRARGNRAANINIAAVGNPFAANNFNNGFNAAAVRVNGVRNGRQNRNQDVNINVAVGANRFNNAAVLFAPSGFHSNSVRFNAFGVRTFRDGFGNVFEQDAFGNVRLVGNDFNRGFQGAAFSAVQFRGLGHVGFGGFHNAGFSNPSVAAFVPLSNCH